MKVVLCSSEVFPYAKTGGLADVTGALPFALAKNGCQVKVFMPFYKKVKPAKMLGEYGYTKEGKVEFYFIKHDDYFFRDGLYGTPQGDYPDNAERFSFFSKKIFEVLKKINFSPDVLHSNDWQAALTNVYLKTLYAKDPFFKKTKSVFTIHNLAYQGLFAKEKFPVLGLPWDYFTMQYFEFYGKVNLLKAGIVFSDMVTTVSPTYAKQIQTPDYGCGLDGVLREKRERLVGILNAIDYDVWNPKTDALIYEKYSALNLKDKAVNKKMFQRALGLKVDPDVFVMGMVSRLAEQKGVDILSEAMDYILKKYQVIILGVGDQKYQDLLKKKAQKFNKSFSLQLAFDEAIAHRIYAACDGFLMPSRFEPCGLSQMISYKYATIPIVHSTGGLVDTVIDVDKKGSGFVFTEYSSDALISCIDRAAHLHRKAPAWQALLKKAANLNFSWDAAARKYMDMYKRTISIK